MSILIADDNEQMRRMIKALVSDLTETIYECSDGAEAVAAYAEHRPDWVLMDIKMKRLDGLSAARQIRSRFPDARIVIVTNYDDAELRKRAIEAGALEYVIKERMVELRRIVADGDERSIESQ